MKERKTEERNEKRTGENESCVLSPSRQQLFSDKKQKTRSNW